MSVPSFRAPRAARPPSPRAPRPRRALRVTGETLRGWSDPPPNWPNAETEWIVWEDLVKRGYKIYGRPNVKGQTLNYAEADVEFQPAIPVAQINVSGKAFRGDFLIIPGRKGPHPGPEFSRGIILDPITNWTHRNSGEDRIRRGILAQSGYLLVWIDAAKDGPLYTRPHSVITAALYGRDDSSIDRGAR